MLYYLSPLRYLTCFFISFLVPKKPFSTSSPKYLNQFRANSSQTESLSCKFLGDPTPSIAWYKDNEPIDIKNNPHFTASEDGFGGSTLNMVSLSKHHHGFYYCNATNFHGSSTSDRSTVQITCKYFHFLSNCATRRQKSVITMSF